MDDASRPRADDQDWQYWQRPPAAAADATRRGTQYLQLLRTLAVDPRWIDLTHIADPPGVALGWIGQHIHRVNQRLYAILTDLLACFEPPQRPLVQLFAAPIAPAAGVDGFVSRRTLPITLIIDPGRIVPADWPGLVAHELAHGVAGAAGHSEGFGRAIAHLCLAQDLPLPDPHWPADRLRAWPPCRRQPCPSAFWLGQVPFP